MSTNDFDNQEARMSVDVEAKRHKLSFIRKIVKAPNAPPKHHILYVSDKSDKMEVIDSVDLTEEDPLDIENVDVKIGLQDVPLIELDETDPLQLTLNTFEGIELKDPLALNDENEAVENDDHRFCDICGEFFSAGDRYHCKRSCINKETSVTPSEGNRICSTCGEFYPSFEPYHCMKSVSKTLPTKPICHHCNKVYQSHEQLEKHMYTHSNLPYICDRCGKFFSDKEDLKNHASTHGSRIIQCSVCKKICDNKIDYLIHTKKKSMPIVCTCGSVFYSYCHLFRHSAKCPSRIDICNNDKKSVCADYHRVGIGEERFNCPYCEKQYSRKDALTRHLRKNKSRPQIDGPITCKLCPNTFEFKCVLDKHRREEHGDELKHDNEEAVSSDNNSNAEDIKSDTSVNVKVPSVPVSVPNGMLLRARLQRDSPTESNVIAKSEDRPLTEVGKCNVCDVKFSHADALRQHMQDIHFQTKEYSCRACSRTFVDEETLTLHMNRHHQQSGNFKCDLCDRSFDEERRLQRHVAWHKGAIYNCNDCGMLFTCSRHRQLHYNKFKHGKSKSAIKQDTNKVDVSNQREPGKVDIVKPPEQSVSVSESKAIVKRGGSFTGKIGMTYIELWDYVKDKVKPFLCEFCNRPWRSKVNFIEHYLTHTKEKPFKCSECSSSFVREQKLKEHRLTHKKRFAVPEIKKRDASSDSKANLLKLPPRLRHLRLRTLTIRLDRFDQSSSVEKSVDNCLLENPAEYSFKCDSCGKSFLRKVSLSAHQKTCLSKKRVKKDDLILPGLPKCKVANDTLTFTVCGLEHRTFILNGRREFLCGGCGKIFPSYELLVKHCSIHSEKKPFKCTICTDRQFMLRSSLRKHHRKCHLNAGVQDSRTTEKKVTAPTTSPVDSVLTKNPVIGEQTKSLVNNKQETKKQHQDIQSDKPLNVKQTRNSVDGGQTGNLIANKQQSKKQTQDTPTNIKNEILLIDDDTDWSSLCQTELVENGTEPAACQDSRATNALENMLQRSSKEVEFLCSTRTQLDVDVIDIFEPQIIIEKEERLEEEPLQACSQQQMQGNRNVNKEANVPFSYNYDMFDQQQFADLSMNHFLEPAAENIVGNVEIMQPTSNVFEDNIVCIQCNAVFSRREDLAQHYATHDSFGDPLTCVICKREFTKRPYLIRHGVVHTLAREMKCSFCGKLFRSNRDLTDHERMHTGEKPFSCTQCGRQFRLKKSLQIHLRIHAGTKPYVCGKCGTPYAAAQTFKHHVRLCLQDNRIEVSSNDFQEKYTEVLENC